MDTQRILLASKPKKSWYSTFQVAFGLLIGILSATALLAGIVNHTLRLAEFPNDWYIVFNLVCGGLLTAQGLVTMQRKVGFIEISERTMLLKPDPNSAGETIRRDNIQDVHLRLETATLVLGDGTRRVIDFRQADYDDIQALRRLLPQIQSIVPRATSASSS